MTPSATQNEKDLTQQGKTEQTAATGNQATVVANNDQYKGPVADTDYYKNQVQAGTVATNAGADAAARNLKQSMEAAGVQGNSGVAAGNSTALDALRSSQLAGVKTNAFHDTADMQQRANAGDIAVAGQQTGAAENYSDVANQDAQQRQQQGAMAKSALFGAITNAGMTAATGGMSGAGKLFK